MINFTFLEENANIAKYKDEESFFTHNNPRNLKKTLSLSGELFIISSKIL